MSSKGENPKLAIFDLGNVVFNIDLNAMFETWSFYSGVAVDTLKERAKIDEKFEQFERNDITSLDFHRHINIMLDINLSYVEFCDGWNAIFKEANEEICTLLPILKPLMQVVAYSNTNEVHVPVWLERYANELQHFDEIFISSKIGLRKPEPEGFQHVLKQRGVAASECVFFDDLEPNITGAEQLGIKAVLVDSPSKVRYALRQMGIDII
jgi:epoxide hydrolase-like predicted phosphatase